MSFGARARIVIVGAGFGGLAMGSALRRAGIDDFVIVEKGQDVGGVWRENTYPGCSCDVPSHLYSLSARPYRNARTRHPSQAEILDYLRDFTAAEGLRPHLRLGTALTGAHYDDSSGTWTLTVTGGGEYLAETVVFAVGQLHRPFRPDIPGLDSFGGAAFHSARWDHSVPLAGRKVAVIGTGSSGAQLLPHVAAVADQVTVYQRTPHWVLPKPRAEFGPVLRRALAVPGMHSVYRKALYYGADLTLTPLLRGGWSAGLAERIARTHLRREVPDPALRAALTPGHPIGAKRILFDSTIYRALQRDNVELVTDPLRRITADGIETGGGRHRPHDVLVFATGFRASEFLTPITVRGRGGALLGERWRTAPDAYLGLAVPQFPNLFLIAGPNSFISTGSNPEIKERQIAFILKCLRWQEESGLRAIEINPVAASRYRQWLQGRLDRTVLGADVPSWYKNADGAVTNPWPASARQFARMTATHPAESFHAVQLSRCTCAG
ncbi:flavin-containing monooxygenase [Nocardia stercoris]|uniref:flavin-containing monooxygenase n=1 Tax=Nocardia stercoris TaxID=2483361 RepID=UPI001F311CEA|nr:NAD(P)/FAD-dependent oxidoreductase [Nocardia stercoris]